MELTTSLCVLGVTTILLFYSWRILNWLWFKPKRIEKFLRDQGLDGTTYKFVFGDLKEMARMTSEATSKPMSLTHDIAPRVLPFFHRALTMLGKNCFTWMGTMPVLHVSEPAMIREVLANYNKFQKPKGGNPLISMVISGLFDADADKWVKHRKIINPAFQFQKLKNMIDAFYMSCNEMIETWEVMTTAKSSCEVDVFPYLEAFTSDAISRTAFSSSYEEGRKIFEILKEQAELMLKAANSFYIPGSRFLPTENNKRMKENNKEVTGLIRSIINRRIDAMEAGETSKDDLLGILLDSSNEEINMQGNINCGLSIDEIIEECKLFYFGGQETTANMLVWTMILLGKHVDWQTRAREEVLHVFGDRKPDLEGLNKLKVINIIFNEVLRLYPPAVLLRRLIHEETELLNLTLPAGTLIQINALILHHDKDTWGDDVNEFNPQRFSEGVLKVTKGQAVYLPFGAGPRTCIGQSFAMLEAKIALAMILQRFSFELSPSYSHAPYSILTLQTQFGAHLILHKL